MDTSIVAKAHFERIEPVIIQMISRSQSSVQIVMAWLTSPMIKKALLRVKRRKQNIRIEIVVDDNDINAAYFLDTEDEFRDAGIEIKKKIDTRFLHRKFMVVDGLYTMVGSYNYTRKANEMLRMLP